MTAGETTVPTAGPTPDDSARAAITASFGRTLFVEAAAGTGKTRSLIERIVTMVATGHVELAEVAAITFTEAAAAELRERLRRALEEVAAGGDEPASGRCRAAIAQLEDAAVCTLHSFAQRVLAEHPLEAGLPPTLEVVDDMGASVGFAEAWKRFSDQLLADESVDEVIRRGLAVRLSLSRLAEVALELHQHWDRLREVTIEPKALPAVSAAPLVEALRAACALSEGCTDDGDALLAHLHRVGELADRLEKVDDELTVLATLADAGPIHRRGVGRASNWPDGGKDAVLAALEAAQAEADAMVLGTRASVLSVLLGRLVAFVLATADERRRTGRLEFHDLLVRARDLLRDRPDVRRAVASRHRLVHVDEFQDTDPLQIEIAALLCHDAETAIGSWAESAVGAGRLVLVGDPKQSIYRFRRADIDLYHQVQDHFSEGLERLTTNFRSDPTIVTWVNHVFEGLMGEGTHGIQPAYVAMHPFRAADGDAPRVVRLGAEWAPDTSLAEMRATEAVEVARLARRARGQWLVEANGQRRPADFGDMAILIPTRRTLAHLETALRAEGVPFRVEARSLLFATQEVRDLVAVLGAVDDPGDRIALLAALRSPAFGCSDVELLEYRRAGGSWSPLSPPPAALAADHPVVEAMATLAELHERARWTPVSVLVEAVVVERRCKEAAFAHDRPRDVWRRLDYVVDQARAFTDSGGASLRDFVAFLHQQADEGVTVNEAVVPEPDDDAVRILTIHGSKGLEFPVVFLTGLNVERRPRTGSVLFGRDGRLEVRAGADPPGWHTDGYATVSRDERAAQEAEDLRLLYVAATRARDHLVVSVHHRERTRCLAADVLAVCEGADDLWTSADLDAPPADPAPSPAPPRSQAGVGAATATPLDRDAWVADRAERIGRLSRAPVVAATAVAHDEAFLSGASERHALDADHDDGSTEPWRRGRAGTALGRAVHSVLQSVDLATGEGVDEVAAAQADAEGIPDRAAEIAHLARTALASATVQAAVASGRMWRELYVAAPIGGVLLEGYVDLLYETPEGMVVVDYKTDRLDADAVDEAVARYRLQGAAYAAALEAALGRPVHRSVFVFVGTGHPIEREVAGLPGAVEEVRAHLRAQRAESPVR